MACARCSPAGKSSRSNTRPNARCRSSSRVDAGTVEMVRSLGIEVVSSAARPDPVRGRSLVPGPRSRRTASPRRRSTGSSTRRFAHRRRLISGITEAEAVDFIVRRFAKEELESECPPVVATEAHSGDPHYEPTPDLSAPIGRDRGADRPLGEGKDFRGRLRGHHLGRLHLDATSRPIS